MGLEMDKLGRSVLRSILRWGSRENRREAQLSLEISSHLENIKLKPNVSTMVRNTAQLREIVLQAYRENVNSQDTIDDALRLLRALNEKGAELDKCYQQRLLNMKDDVLQHRIFAIGDVVVHRETSTRCVVVGWRVDDETGEQYLSLLVDQLDAHEYLRAGHPLLSQPSLESVEESAEGDGADANLGGMIDDDGSMVVDIDTLSANLESMGKQNIDSVANAMKKKSLGGMNAKDFTRVTDAALQRICNEARSPSLYFDGFDEISGRFVPGSDLMNLYPMDVHPMDHTRGHTELSARLANEKERMAVVGAVAHMAAQVAETLRGILAERGLGDNVDPHSLQEVSEQERKQLMIGHDIVEEVKGKIVELLEAATQLELLHQSHAGRTIPALEELVAYAAALEAENGKDVPNLRVPPAITNSVVEDDTVFRVVSMLTAVYQSIDHMLELRFQDRGRGYYEREVALRFPEYDPDATQIAREAISIDSDTTGALQEGEKEGGGVLGIKEVSPVVFRIGEVVRHRKFGYRGVVLGWDIRPLGDATAIASRWEGVVGLPSGADQPFYRILPDEQDVETFLGPGSFRSSFYVAEENLQLVPLGWEAEQGGEIDVLNSRRPENMHAQRSEVDSALDELQASRTIEHRFMSLYFSSYHTPTGRYISPHRRHFQFPDRDMDSDFNSLQASAAASGSADSDAAGEGNMKVGNESGNSQSSIELKLAEVRASQAAERESRDYYNPYTRDPAASSTADDHHEEDYDIDDDDDEEEEHQNSDVAAVSARLGDIENSLKAQLAEHRRNAVHRIRRHRLSSITEKERADVEEMAAEEGSGQALAEDALYSMLGYLRTVFNECRVSSKGGLEASVPLPSSTTAVMALQLSHLASLLRTARKREDALAIESAIWICLSAHPDYRVSGELSKGTELTKSGYDKEALHAFKRAATLDPSYSEPLNKISALHHRSGNHRRSLKYAQKVLTLVPGHFGALAGISMAYEVASKYDDSARALRSTLTSHPWATRGPTVLAALQKKIDSRRNESVVEEVLAGLDSAVNRRATSSPSASAEEEGNQNKMNEPAPGVIRNTRKRGHKSDTSSNRGATAAARKEKEEGE